MLKAASSCCRWNPHEKTPPGRIDAIYTYGHPLVDAALLDRLPGLRVVSNFGVGVDHIDVAAAAARGVPVGNTPGVLDGATADMAFALLLAAGRRLAEGDRYARGPNFLHYDPSYMLGREVHGSTLGVIGMGRIGEQVARRARGFDMTVLYHNRRRRAGCRRGAGRAVRLARRTAGHRRLRHAHRAAHGGDAAADRAGGTLADETDRHSRQHRPRRRRGHGRPHRSAGRPHDLCRRPRRDRPGAAAARPSAIASRQCHHYAAPGQRHRADAAAHGGDVGRKPDGRAVRAGRCRFR